MNSIYRLKALDRRDLIAQTAARMRVSPVIVEKDIWVCAVLEAIFASADQRNRFVFKGGTSLSKAFAAIGEKATILHQQAYSDAPLPQRYARHYYDLVMLMRAGVGPRALRDTRLLADVVAFKERFYWSAGARYDLAKAGTFRLLPPPDKLGTVERDYAAMEVMFFADPPPWEEITEELVRLERMMNGE